MFATMTVFWILNVVTTFSVIDSLNDVENIVIACYGSDNASLCVEHEVMVFRASQRATVWLAMCLDIFLVNVSSAWHRVPVYPHIIRKHPS
jgi:hypothetical protein